MWERVRSTLTAKETLDLTHGENIREKGPREGGGQREKKTTQKAIENKPPKLMAMELGEEPGKTPLIRLHSTIH